MTRIAVAGTGGLARLIAHYIDGETAHQVLLISRTVCCLDITSFEVMDRRKQS